jgi:ABC-type uncharacterized transport system substrate-binding protein
MRLIGLAVILTLSLILVSFAGEAQTPGKVPRVGYLHPGSPSDPLRQRRLEAFRQGLRDLGYVEGQNIAIESRWAEGQYDRYPALAADLVRLKVEVIVAVTGAATQVAQQATRTIPIVMSAVADPVGSGLVASLARPGGNVTGLTGMSPDLVGKQLQLLKQVVPEVSRVALLSASRQSSQPSPLAGGGGCSSDLGGAASNPGGAEPPGDRQRPRGDDQGEGWRAPDNPGCPIRESAKTNRRARDRGAPAIAI